MSNKKEPSRLKKIIGLPKKGWQATAAGVGRGRVALRNLRRRRKKIDFVVISLRGSFPELDEPRRSFVQRQLPLPPPPMSLQSLNDRLRRIADADNVGGVILNLDGLSVGLATLQSLRQSIGRLQSARKRVVVYTPMLSNGLYYLATAADKIIVPPSANFEAMGLYSDITFLKDALAHWGVRFENLQISPYKTAYNNLSESGVTAEQKEQIDWLLDDQYDLLTGGMAEGRGKTTAEMQHFIDHAPYTAEQMVELGLVDMVGYEDQFGDLLYEPPAAEAEKPQPRRLRFRRKSKQLEEIGELEDSSEKEEERERPQATILGWDEARRKLMGRYRRRVRGQKIGVISVEGAIMMGESRSTPLGLPLPIIGTQTAGAQTFIKQMRAAEADDRIAALVLHVDSPGGMALAADLMNRELVRWRQKKPLVVYMGNVAASGGYYISTHAHHIVSQPGTITGSIGVIAGRPNLKALYAKLKLGRASFQRGAHAHLYGGDDPLSEEEFEVLMSGIRHSYHQFKTVVADGRQLPYDELDEICLGKVWTGRQAVGHKLVDSHGDLLTAIEKAAELAELPTDNYHQIMIEEVEREEGAVPLPKPFAAEAGALLAPFLGDALSQLQGHLYLLPFTWKMRL